MELLHIEQIDTYSYIGDELYNKIMEISEVMTQNENSIHVFGVIGIEKKVNYVYTILEEGIKKNFDRILNNRKIKIGTKNLDSIGNHFYRCVQEFYCDKLHYLPKKMVFNFDDASFYGIYGSSMNDKQAYDVVNEIVSCWIEQEKPLICGKQLITRSFFLKDFVGRKLITAMPETESNSWRLIFEGGHQLNINENLLYSKGTLNPNDLGVFCTSNVQSVLLNPIYAYGKWFYPNDICEEWHKVFLYLCAVSEYEWNLSNMGNVYRRFLKFLEENICLTMKVDPLISKEQYYKVLLIHIENYRAFLKGEDEVVNSKDLYQTLNTRYVYLPYLQELVKQENLQHSFSCFELQKEIDCALQETDIYKKGKKWENVAEYVLNSVEGWKITGKRIRAGAQEIDLSVANISLDDELWQMGAYILIECKNWKKHVGIQQIRNIAHISSMKGNKTAILFTANGITSDSQEEIQRLAMTNIYIICITAVELKQLQSAVECKKLILDKWKSLQDSIEVSGII